MTSCRKKAIQDKVETDKVIVSESVSVEENFTSEDTTEKTSEETREETKKETLEETSLRGVADESRSEEVSDTVASSIDQEEASEKEDISTNATSKETEKSTKKETTQAESSETKSSHVHTYNEKVTKEPDCQSVGRKTYVCACGETYEKTFGSVTGHTFGAYVNVDSLSHKRVCTVCEYEFVENHNYANVTDYSGSYKHCETCGHDERINDYSSLINQEYAIENQERANNGLPGFNYNSAAQYIADRRAREIVSDFSHNGIATLPANEVGIICNYTMGENIAYGYVSAADVHSGWMNSSGHRENILRSSFTSITIGVYSEGNIIYWVQIFGDK